MTDVSFAISTLPTALPAEGDYDALCQALMASGRGRWFLEEYAKRNRNADTLLVLDAVARVEAVVRSEQESRAVQGMRIELLEMARTIAQTRADVAESRPAPRAAEAPPDGAVDIFAAAGRLQDLAWTMRERGLDMAMCDQIADLSSAILSASSLRNPSDGRSQKLAEVLRSLERRIDAMLSDASQPARSNGSADANGAGERHAIPMATVPMELPAGEPAAADSAAVAPPAESLPFAAIVASEPPAATAAPVDDAAFALDAILVQPLPEAVDATAVAAPTPPEQPVPPQPAAALELDDFLLAPLPMPGVAEAAPAASAPPADPLAALRAMSPAERIALFT